MEWYWWVLIALAVGVISVLKIRVWKMIQERRKNRTIDDEDIEG